MRSALAGFRCPCCGALLPYGEARGLIYGAIEDAHKRVVPVCLTCREEFLVKPPSTIMRQRGSRRWAIAAVGNILAGLAVFGALRGLTPGVPAGLALGIGAVVGFAPLPLLEAWAMRPMVDFRKIKRRRTGA